MCMGFASRVTDLSSETLLLDGGVEDYEYLNKSRREVDGIDDTERERGQGKIFIDGEFFLAFA